MAHWALDHLSLDQETTLLEGNFWCLWSGQDLTQRLTDSQVYPLKRFGQVPGTNLGNLQKGLKAMESRKETQRHHWVTQKTINTNQTLSQGQYLRPRRHRRLHPNPRRQPQLPLNDEKLPLHQAHHHPFQQRLSKASSHPGHTWELDQDPKRMDVPWAYLLLRGHSTKNARRKTKVRSSR